MLNKINLGTLLLGLSLAIYTLDFSVFGPVTTNRLAILFIILGYSILIKTNTFKHFDLSDENKRLKRELSLVIILSITATLLSSIYHQDDLTVVFGWFFVILTNNLILPIIKVPDFKLKILKSAAFYFSILIILLFFICVNKYGLNAGKDLDLRSYVNEFGPGLSRIITGIVCGNILVTLYYFKSEINKKRVLIYTIFIYTISFWIIISTHSRQGLIGLILIIFGSLIYLFEQSSKKILIGTTFVAFSFLALTQLFNSDTFQERYVNRTESQLEDGEGSTADRIYFYEQGAKLFSENVIFGVGPKNYQTIVGFDAHSGYMLETSETGILTFIGILLFFGLVTKYIFKGFRKLKGVPYSILIIVIVLVPFFKSIYNSPMIWCTLLLVIDELNFKIKPQKKLANDNK